MNVFTNNRTRFLDGEVFEKFLFSTVLEKARGAGLLSEEHCIVDGTLIAPTSRSRRCSRSNSARYLRAASTRLTPGNDRTPISGERSDDIPRFARA